jgi:hypothetical protein
MMGMRMVCWVWPRTNSTRPDTASKSMPAVAVPLTVSNWAEIVSVCGAPVTCTCRSRVGVRGQGSGVRVRVGCTSRSRNFSFSLTLTPTLTNCIAGLASACARPALPPPASTSVGAALAWLGVTVGG